MPKFCIYIFILGVRSLAIASRARQFNPLNPLGWGGYRFLKQIWQPWSVVRGRAWSCVVVRGRARSCAVVRGRARSCTVMRAWAVMRGRARSCVVVHGRAWSAMRGRVRSCRARPRMTCVPNLGAIRRPVRKFCLSNL